MSNMVVYTVVVGGYDVVMPALFPDQVDYVCFSDQSVGIPGWEYRPMEDLLENPRRASRRPKLMPHKFLPEYEVSLYHDANCQLLEDPVALCDEWLGDKNLALFRHPWRDCLYAEATICAGFKLDAAARFHQQTTWYQADGMPSNWGLFQGSVIVRRHMTEEIRLFGSKWQMEYHYGSCRDQISLAYTLWKTGVQFTVIPGTLYNDSRFTFRSH